MKKLYVFKLGSESKGFIPSRRSFEELRQQLNNCILNGGDVNVLLTNPFLKIEIVDVPDDMKLGVEFDVSWEELEERHREERAGLMRDFELRLAEAREDARIAHVSGDEHIAYLRGELAKAKRPWWMKLFGK